MGCHGTEKTNLIDGSLAYQNYQTFQEFVEVNTGVSKNRGTPKSSILVGFSIINHPFWGTVIFGNSHMTFPSSRAKKRAARVPWQNILPSIRRWELIAWYD